MNIHEYQAKELLRRFGIPVPKGRVASTPEEAKAITAELGIPVVVKAQIHAGGRGKAGGIQTAENPDTAEKKARELIGKNLVTHQTGPQGRRVRKVLIEEVFPIAAEFYLALVVDRAASRVSFIGSSEGGMEIEEVARKSPQKIVREVVDPAAGLLSFQCRRLALGLKLPSDKASALISLMQSLYRLFVESDCALAEINPLVLSKGGSLIALDAKVSFDRNAFFRRPEIAALRDIEEEDPREVEADRFDLSYISLDGNIACMVNGAGLAMATMDIIKLCGGEPANFLDVGGGATKERVAQAFRLLVSDQRVRGVLVNIFGGIMRCDVIAQGIVDAARETGVTVPLVVRLQGTNVELGRKILSESGLSIIPAETMAEAAEKIVKAVGKR